MGYPPSRADVIWRLYEIVESVARGNGEVDIVAQTQMAPGGKMLPSAVATLGGT